MKKMKNYFSLMVLSLITMSLVGCSGSVKNMRVVSQDSIVTSPKPGKSLVIFMRPSGIGFAIQSSVFKVVNETPELVGIAAAKKQFACEVDPGEHLFMVVGESADFMSAELQADKTYYAYVAPRMGLWKARFSVTPVTPEERQTDTFKECQSGCEWVELSEESANWAASNAEDVQTKYL
ncbi:MAG: hypothetical protein N0C79_08525, partial [Candidatus Thiodiazotropha taylori]|nr:hypothetical protein [Candidatus Thiodiazotropha taylori]